MTKQQQSLSNFFGGATASSNKSTSPSSKQSRLSTFFPKKNGDNESQKENTINAKDNETNEKNKNGLDGVTDPPTKSTVRSKKQKLQKDSSDDIINIESDDIKGNSDGKRKRDDKLNIGQSPKSKCVEEKKHIKTRFIIDDDDDDEDDNAEEEDIEEKINEESGNKNNCIDDEQVVDDDDVTVSYSEDDAENKNVINKHDTSASNKNPAVVNEEKAPISGYDHDCDDTDDNRKDDEYSDDDDVDDENDEGDDSDVDMDETLESIADTKHEKGKKSKVGSKTSTKAKENNTMKKNAFDMLSNGNKNNKVNNTKSNSTAIPTDEQIMEQYTSDLPKSSNNPPSSNAKAQQTSILYSSLCNTFAQIEAITARLEIQKLLTSLLRYVLMQSPNDLLPIIYLASNSVSAAYECVELGIGDAILIKAIGEASGSNPAIIKSRYESEGDLGLVSMNAKGKQRTLGFGIKPKPLMARDVLDVFRQIANTSGGQSQKWKVDKIKGLLVRANAETTEAKYIIRGLQGKLRIGLAQSTVLISLAHAVLLSSPIDQTRNKSSKEALKSDTNDVSTGKNRFKDPDIVCNSKLPIESRLEAAVNIVKKAYCEVSSFDALINALLSTPIYRLNEVCSLHPGIPVEPMLAKPTKSVLEVLKRLNGQRFTCEFKYDGERAQVHMSSDGVTKVFSRSLLDTSEKFPEVPLYVKEASNPNVTSFVLDTEVVAYNRETKQFVPFQVLSTRKKTEESEEKAKVKVIVQAFDLMFLNGNSLLDRTLSERRDLLKEHFHVVDGKFQFAKSIDHKEDGDTALVEEFLDQAVKGQCEGLMVKTLDENASYQPSYRSLNWLKLKKDYLEGMGDSFDLVPIGAFYGKGKRTGVYGAYLLACYDLDTEEFQSVCKIGTGFSDDDLKSLSSGLNQHVIPEKSSQYSVSKSLECDVWFDACQVWEVKAADLSKSSVHRGAADKTGESGRGIGLRFPRFERVREDKKPEQATSSDQVLEMYYAQDSIVDDGNGDDNYDDGI